MLAVALAACDGKDPEKPRVWPHELAALAPVPQQPRDPNQVDAWVDATGKTVGVYGRINICIIQAARTYCTFSHYAPLVDERGLQWILTQAGDYIPAADYPLFVFRRYVTAEADCSGARYIEETPLNVTFGLPDAPDKVFARTAASTCQNVTVSGSIPSSWLPLGRCAAETTPTSMCVYTPAPLEVTPPPPLQKPVHVEERILPDSLIPHCDDWPEEPWEIKPWCYLTYDAENRLLGPAGNSNATGGLTARDDAHHWWQLVEEGPRPFTEVNAAYAFTTPDCTGEEYLTLSPPASTGVLFQVGPGAGHRAFVAKEGGSMDIAVGSRWVDGACTTVEPAEQAQGLWPLSALQEVAPPDWTAPFRLTLR